MQQQDISTFSRDEWLALRTNGIGGSDAAAVMGANQFKSAFALYYDKLGLTEQNEPDASAAERMWWGTAQEDLVAQRFTELTGIQVERDTTMYVHPDYEWMFGDIDRRVVGEQVGLECKTTEVYNKADFKNDDIPANYYWQCMHYMAVTGWETWYLAVKVGNGAGFYVFRIDRDENVINQLVEAEKHFWCECVQKHIPPLPTGSEADENIIQSIGAADEYSENIDVDDMNDTLVMRGMLDEQRAELDKQISAIDQQIKIRMANAKRAVSTNYKISYLEQSRATTDYKALAQGHPEIKAILDEYTRKSTYRVLRIKELKK